MRVRHESISFSSSAPVSFAMQIFVRTDRSLTLDVTPSDTVAGVKRKIADKTALPAEHMRLILAGRQLCDENNLHELNVERHCTVHVVHSLRGGKGGFGAMLRTAGARGVKTTNFDACRDLNGRRLRHVNAEAALREWDSKAEERKLKKQQDLALNAKPSGPAPIARFDEEEYDEMLEGARSRVTDALAAGLAASSSAEGEGGASSSAAGDGPDAPADDGAASTHPIATAGGPPAPSAVALGKRKAPVLPAGGGEAPAAPPKAAKLNAAFDPLAALGGDSDDDDDDDE